MGNPGAEDRPIPVNAEVRCSDGVFGKSTYVLMNPVTEKVTDLVVRHATAPHTEYIVPLSAVETATDDFILLRNTREELRHMDPFNQKEYIEEKMPSYVAEGHAASYMYYYPYVEPEQEFRIPVEVPQVPPGELAVRRGTRVEATDGPVGRVDEFLVHPETGHITHLVMREGHLWGQKDVSIPVSEISKTTEEAVYLNIDRRQIESLPSIPIHRHHALGGSRT